MNPEVQKKIDRIAELVRQRDAIDRELEAMLGVAPAKPALTVVEAGEYRLEEYKKPAASPAASTVRKCGSCGQPGHTWRTCKNEKAQREAFFEKQEIENDDANDDVPAKPLVPPITQRPKLNYDKEALEADIRSGHLSPTTIASRHGVGIATVYQIKSVMAPTPAEKPHEVTELSEDTIEQIQDLRDRNKTTTEIANMLALNFEKVAAVPARSGRPKNKPRNEEEEEADQLPEELQPKEDYESEDDEVCDPFAYRGKVAGSEI